MKPCPSFPGYFADESGTVHSTRARHGPVPARPLTPQGGAGKNGRYTNIGVYLNGGRRKAVGVHTLVADAFLGPRPPGMQLNHKDGNPRNNRPENLEYATPAVNSGHAVVLTENARLRAELSELRAVVREAHGVLEAIRECPYTIDPATVPAAGPEAAPHQVVGTLSLAMVKRARILAALARLAPFVPHPEEEGT